MTIVLIETQKDSVSCSIFIFIRSSLFEIMIKGCVNLYPNVPLNILSPINLTRIRTRISKASRFLDPRSDFQHWNSSSIFDQNSNQNLSRIPVIKEVEATSFMNWFSGRINLKKFRNISTNIDEVNKLADTTIKEYYLERFGIQTSSSFVKIW